jgi:hypothetical protein
MNHLPTDVLPYLEMLTEVLFHQNQMLGTGYGDAKENSSWTSYSDYIPFLQKRILITF